MSTAMRRASLACAVAMLGFPLGAYAELKAVIGEKAADGAVTLYSQRFQETLEDGAAVADLSVTVLNGHLQLARKGYPAGSCRVETTAIVDQAGNPVPAGVAADTQLLFIVNGEPVTLTRCIDAGCQGKSGFPSTGPEPFNVAWCDVTPVSKQQCACHEFVRGAVRVRPGTDCRRTIADSVLSVTYWVLAAYIINDY